MSDDAIQIVGYVAMGLVAISFLMRDIKALRFMNMIGAATFIWWGILLNQAPIYLLNTFIVLVNLYYLLKPTPPKK